MEQEQLELTGPRMPMAAQERRRHKRVWPTKPFGSMGVIDELIEKNPDQTNPKTRYKVDHLYFENMTLARNYVYSQLGEDPTHDLFTENEVFAGSGYTKVKRKVTPAQCAVLDSMVEVAAAMPASAIVTVAPEVVQSQPEEEIIMAKKESETPIVAGKVVRARGRRPRIPYDIPGLDQMSPEEQKKAKTALKHKREQADRVKLRAFVAMSDEDKGKLSLDEINEIKRISNTAIGKKILEVGTKPMGRPPTKDKTVAKNTTNRWQEVGSAKNLPGVDFNDPRKDHPKKPRNITKPLGRRPKANPEYQLPPGVEAVPIREKQAPMTPIQDHRTRPHELLPALPPAPRYRLNIGDKISVDTNTPDDLDAMIKTLKANNLL